MGFDDRLWAYLVEEHDAHQAAGPAPFTRRRVTARRGITAGVVVLTAAAAGVVVLMQPSSGQSAWAKQTLQRAAAVVIPLGSSNAILHVAATETLSPLAQRAAATTVSTFSEQAWIQQSAPGHKRTITRVPGRPVIEQNSAGQVYNPAANTVYPAPQVPSGKPRYTLTPTGHGGSYRFRVKLPDGSIYTQTLDAGTAKGLRDGTQAVQWAVTWNGHTQKIFPLVGSSAKPSKQQQAQQPSPASTSFAAELHALLDSGHARVTRTTTTDGQPAVEISSVNPQSGPRTNYYVNPTTYAPIELDLFGYDSPNDVTRLHITTYQTLPLAGHQQLLHVSIPANARIDHTPANYWHAIDTPALF